MSVTAERASELIVYSPVTGELRWRTDVSRKCRAGMLAGTWHPDRDGQRYLVIKIDGKNFRGHRLAWLIMTGEEPALQVDHRDGCKSNNRWDNLRLATDSQNKVNRPTSASSKSGIKGVRWRDRDKCWEARISINRKSKTLGYFKSAEAAAVAYREAASTRHGEFAHQG